MVNKTNLSEALAVDQWNNELVLKILPLTIVLAIYLLLAIVGNATVLYIYMRKFRVYSSGRFFIPVLALSDMLAGVANSASFLSETLLPVTFNSDIGCKILWFCCMSTIVPSAFLLLFIAIDRYLIFCKPFGASRQMTQKWRKISVIFCFAVSPIISSPCFLFYGVKSVSKNGGNLTGRRCTCVTGGYPQLGVAFNIVLLVIGVMESTALAVLYFLVGRVIYKASNYENSDKPTESFEIKERASTKAIRLKDQNVSTSITESQSTTYVDQRLSIEDRKIVLLPRVNRTQGK